jgi:hypothetical protein
MGGLLVVCLNSLHLLGMRMNLPEYRIQNITFLLIA